MKAESSGENPFSGPVRSRALYEYKVAQTWIFPTLDRWGIEADGTSVLDVGCGSGGLCVALAEAGSACMGIDLSAERVACAAEMAAEHGVRVEFLEADVLEIDDLKRRFDLITLSEVAEHLESLENVKALLHWCRQHLKEGGRIYVSFPPWLSPFGGHQAGWPIIRYIPWYHLLPRWAQRLLAPGHIARYIAFATELNHLTLGKFEKALRSVGLSVVQQELYVIRPEYRSRYGIRSLRCALVARMPVVREITTMGAYFLLGYCG